MYKIADHYKNMTVEKSDIFNETMQPSETVEDFR